MLLLFLSGCHRSAPSGPAPAAKEASRQAAPNSGAFSAGDRSAMQREGDEIRQHAREDIAKDYLLQGTPDDALVKFNAKDGVGIGLKIKDRTVRVGQPILLHVVYEDIGAPAPLSGNLCPGLYAGYVSLDTGELGFGQYYEGKGCDDDAGKPLKLVPGKVYTVDFPMTHTRSQPKKPGRYAVSVSWQPVKAGYYPLGKESMDSARGSNLVEVDIKP